MVGLPESVLMSLRRFEGAAARNAARIDLVFVSVKPKKTRPSPETAFGQPVSVGPQPGVLVAMQRWPRHMLHPFAGEGARVASAS